MIRNLIFILLLLPYIAFAKPILYEYHFTVHTYDFEPVENYEGFSYYQDKIVLILRWKELDQNKSNTVRYMIKDGLGNTVKDDYITTKTSTSHFSNYVTYRYKKNSDFPGDWYFYVWMDDELYLEEMKYISE